MLQLDILCHQAKLPASRMGYMLLLWPHSNHHTSQTVVYFLQPDGKALLLQKTTLTLCHSTQRSRLY